MEEEEHIVEIVEEEEEVKKKPKLKKVKKNLEEKMKTDEFAPPEPPRLIQKLSRRKLVRSNFLVTVNTNKQFTGNEDTYDQVKTRFASALDQVFGQNVAELIRLTDKAAERGDLKNGKFIKSIEIQKCIEIAPKTNKLHAHILIAIGHYTLLRYDNPIAVKKLMEILSDWYKPGESLYASFIFGKDSKHSFEEYIRKSETDQFEKQKLATFKKK